MADLKEYAVRIEGPNDYYRFASKRMTITESIGGSSIDRDYLPFLSSIEEPSSEVDFDSDTPIPSYSVEVWDPNRETISDFKNEFYQAARCTIFEFVDGSRDSTYDGYMTDVEVNDGTLSFKVRLSEDTFHDDFLETFSPDSFQHFEHRKPQDVSTKLSMNRHSDTPWQVASALESIQARVAQVDAVTTDTSGDPVHVVYHSQNQNSLRYLKWDPGNGIQQDILIGGDFDSEEGRAINDIDSVGYEFDIVLDSSGDPIVVYADQNVGELKFTRYDSSANVQDWINPVLIDNIDKDHYVQPEICIGATGADDIDVAYLKHSFAIAHARTTDLGSSWNVNREVVFNSVIQGGDPFLEIYGLESNSTDSAVHMVIWNGDGGGKLEHYLFSGGTWTKTYTNDPSNANQVYTHGNTDIQLSQDRLNFAYGDKSGTVWFESLSRNGGSWDVNSQMHSVASDGNFSYGGSTSWDTYPIYVGDQIDVEHNQSNDDIYVYIAKTDLSTSSSNHATKFAIEGYYYDQSANSWNTDGDNPIAPRKNNSYSDILSGFTMAQQDGKVAFFYGLKPLSNLNMYNVPFVDPYLDGDTGTINKLVSQVTIETEEVVAISRKAANFSRIIEIDLSDSFRNSSAPDIRYGIELDMGVNSNTYKTFEWDNNLETLVAKVQTLWPNSGKAVVGNPASESYDVVEYERIIEHPSDNRNNMVLVFSKNKSEGSGVGKSVHNGAASLIGLSKGNSFYNNNPLVIRPMNPEEPSTSPSNADNRDVVYVKANGFLPFDGDEDPNLTNGFFDAGEKLDKDDFERVSGGNIFVKSDEEIRKVYRFHLIDESEISVRGGFTASPGIGYIGLQINNLNYEYFKEHSTSASDPVPYPDISNFDSHPYRVDKPFAQFDISEGYYEDMEAGDPIKFVEANWIVERIDFKTDNIIGNSSVFDDEADNQSRNNADEFQNRIRGSRISMLDTSSDIRKIHRSSSKLDQNLTEYNTALVNQSSSKYGIPIFSKVIYDDDTCQWLERVLFPLPPDFGSPFEEIIVDAKQKNKSKVGSVDRDVGNEPKFDNYLIFERNWRKASNQNNKLGEELAREFFLNKVYRITREQVPENEKDVGKKFPVAYGELNKVPLLHVIGKKAVSGKDWTAGDDAYVYAEHPCDIEGPLDITLYIGDQNSEKPEVDQSDFDANQREDVIESPFPSVVKNHYKEVPTGGTEAITSDPSPLYNPYHKLLNGGDGIETSEGNRVYGVRLRGGEWNHKLGVLDKRYPIRHGIGSTNLYASFSGYVDRSGKFVDRGDVIKHPLDIINHFITKFGDYPFSNNMVDQKSIDEVKSKTRDYVASVYINEYMKPSDLVTKLCRQFGILWYFHKGKIKFSVPDFDYVDQTNPISSNLNIGNKMRESVEGYQDVYTQINYKYKKNNISDDFDHQIILDGSNNKFCRIAENARGQKNPLEVEADYVISSKVAREVSQRLALWNSSKKIFYNFDVVRKDGISLEPGQIVPLTYEPYDIDREPVLIKSVKPGRADMEVGVVRFPDVLKKKLIR